MRSLEVPQLDGQVEPSERGRRGGGGDVMEGKGVVGGSDGSRITTLPGGWRREGSASVHAG